MQSRKKQTKKRQCFPRGDKCAIEGPPASVGVNPAAKIQSFLAWQALIGARWTQKEGSDPRSNLVWNCFTPFWCWNGSLVFDENFHNQGGMRRRQWRVAGENEIQEITKQLGWHDFSEEFSKVIRKVSVQRFRCNWKMKRAFQILVKGEFN